MAQHNDLGQKGEDEAVRYLLSEGYRIVFRNWKMYGYEIDIVAETEEYYVFVEVKTRTTAMYGNPEDFVDKRRRNRMINAADIFLNQYEIDKPARFDIIGILWDGLKLSLEHIDDAFLPSLV